MNLPHGITERDRVLIAGQALAGFASDPNATFESMADHALRATDALLARIAAAQGDANATEPERKPFPFTVEVIDNDLAELRAAGDEAFAANLDRPHLARIDNACGLLVNIRDWLRRQGGES